LNEQGVENGLKTLRALVLVDGFNTQELLESLGRLLQLRDAELLLVYVRGPGPRRGLDLVQMRPGGQRVPPHRERDMADAELDRGATALAEAVTMARRVAAAVQSRQIHGEPGHSVCELAAWERVDVVVLRPGGGGQPIGQTSLGPTARFVTDHSPCPVLLLRGGVYRLA
jgi:nucleotide-binding universal stress UspA family protein